MLETINFLNAPLMSSALKGCGEEDLGKLPAVGLGEETGGHDAYVGIVVLASQTSYLILPTVGSTDATVVVEGHVDAITTTAEGNATSEFASANGVGQWVGIVGIVTTVSRVGTKVNNLIASSNESGFYGLFHIETSVVTGHSNLIFLHFYIKNLDWA